ncbi:MAG TPA: M28 family peptidase, partial [Armatimonadota bacterium]|nr:M28 family peptidase [Armatimonadota bacterium]
MTSRTLRCLLLALPLLAACSDEQGGASPAAEAPSHPAFDADRAHELLKQQVEFGPRIPGTPGHQRQLEWMTEYFRARADTVVVQPFDWTLSTGDTLHLTNLFVRFRPELKDRVLLVTHWDTRPKANEATDPADREKPVPGANDGASGTAVLMQLADVLHRNPPPIGVDLLFVDGEDYGPG